MKRYQVFWSEEDGEWVATCDAFPSLSHLDEKPTGALEGLLDLIRTVELDTKDE